MPKITKEMVTKAHADREVNFWESYTDRPLLFCEIVQGDF